jgi:co-chaperonin GroES (HSP10)
MEKKINFTPMRDYVVCEWYVAPEKDKEKKIILTGNAEQDAIAELNGINEVLAVGEDVKNIKVGDFAMLSHMEVPIVNIDGVQCAMYKAHMIMGTFESKPDVDENKNSKEGPIIKTKKTEQKAVEFKNKYKQ